MELKTAPKGHTIRNNSNRVFNLLKKSKEGKYPATFDIPEEDEVYMEWEDKDGKQREGLRHIRYAIGERSIFVDEQSSEASNKRGTIRFIDGLLVVNEMEKTKLKYLEVCNYNKGNHDNGTALNTRTALFRTDASKYEAKMRLQKNELKRKLYNIVAEYSVEELEGLSLALGVPFPDEKTLSPEDFEASFRYCIQSECFDCSQMSSVVLLFVLEVKVDLFLQLLTLYNRKTQNLAFGAIGV